MQKLFAAGSIAKGLQGGPMVHNPCNGWPAGVAELTSLVVFALADVCLQARGCAGMLRQHVLSAATAASTGLHTTVHVSGQGSMLVMLLQHLCRSALAMDAPLHGVLNMQ